MHHYSSNVMEVATDLLNETEYLNEILWYFIIYVWGLG